MSISKFVKQGGRGLGLRSRPSHTPEPRCRSGLATAPSARGSGETSATWLAVWPSPSFPVWPVFDGAAETCRACLPQRYPTDGRGSRDKQSRTPVLPASVVSRRLLRTKAMAAKHTRGSRRVVERRKGARRGRPPSGRTSSTTSRVFQVGSGRIRSGGDWSLLRGMTDGLVMLAGGAAVRVPCRPRCRVRCIVVLWCSWC